MSVIFRAIPLMMMTVCVAFGLYIWTAADTPGTSSLVGWSPSSLQAAVVDANVFIAARVLVGLGAVCFSLYSIVSILESGTASSE